MRKVLAIAAVAVVLVLAAVAYTNRIPPDAGEITVPGVSDAELLERGQYLATAGNCVSCHTAPGGPFMAGGVPFVTPFGTIYSTNITPDHEHGIGRWSQRDFINSLRHGIRPDGEHLYPAFPYTAFTGITDQDAAALHAWFRTIESSQHTPPANDLPFPFNQRVLMAFWKTLFFSPGPYSPDPSRDEAWNRGAYLVEALAHCGACHTPRNMLGAEDTAHAMSGGEFTAEVVAGGYRPWSTPNLTSSMKGLGLWSEQELSEYLQTGENSFLQTFGPMNEVIFNSTSLLAPRDIAAMSRYLKSLPAIDPPASDRPEPEIMGRGRTVYNLHCGTCHLPTGEGDRDMGPRLNAGSLVVQDANPASMINAILYGPELPDTGLTRRWREPMEEHQYILDDDEIAAVATFVRFSWENAAGIVTPEQVARQRVP